MQAYETIIILNTWEIGFWKLFQKKTNCSLTWLDVVIAQGWTFYSPSCCSKHVWPVWNKM